MLLLLLLLRLHGGDERSQHRPFACELSLRLSFAATSPQRTSVGCFKLAVAVAVSVGVATSTSSPAYFQFTVRSCFVVLRVLNSPCIQFALRMSEHNWRTHTHTHTDAHHRIHLNNWNYKQTQRNQKEKQTIKIAEMRRRRRTIIIIIESASWSVLILSVC